MKKHKQLKPTIIAIVCFVITVVPSFQVYSNNNSLYVHESDALIVNTNSIKEDGELKEAALPAILAVAAGVALVAVAAIGAVDGWNSHHRTTQTISYVNYDKDDFSKFDN